MGIQIEFNPDLALRNISEYKNGNREIEECVPEFFEVGKTYPFLKAGQRNYWLLGELPLVETKGNQELSRPLASIRILEVKHFLRGSEVYTRGMYEVIAVFTDDSIHFDGFTRV